MFEKMSFKIYNSIFPFNCVEAETNGHICTCPDKQSFLFMKFLNDNCIIENVSKENYFNPLPIDRLTIDLLTGLYVIRNSDNTNWNVCPQSDYRVKLLGKKKVTVEINEGNAVVFMMFFPLMMTLGMIMTRNNKDKEHKPVYYLENSTFFIESTSYKHKFGCLVKVIIEAVKNKDDNLNNYVNNLLIFLEKTQELYREKEVIKAQINNFISKISECNQDVYGKSNIYTYVDLIDKRVSKSCTVSDRSNGIFSEDEYLFLENFNYLLYTIKILIKNVNNTVTEITEYDRLGNVIDYFLQEQNIDIKKDNILTGIDFKKKNLEANLDVISRYLRTAYLIL